MDLIKSDVFDTDLSNESQLIVIFGHIGFNELAISWNKFCHDKEELRGVTDPFDEFEKKPKKLTGKCWLWFLPAAENNGIATEDLKQHLDNVFSWVKENEINKVITNGIMDTDSSADTISNRTSHDGRASFIIKYMDSIEKSTECSVTLSSKNDVFVRNTPN